MVAFGVHGGLILLAKGVAAVARATDDGKDALIVPVYPGHVVCGTLPDAGGNCLSTVALTQCEAFCVGWHAHALEEAQKRDAKVSLLLSRALEAEVERRTMLMAEFLTLSPAERLERRCAELAAVLALDVRRVLQRPPIGHGALAMPLGISERQLKRVKAQALSAQRTAPSSTSTVSGA